MTIRRIEKYAALTSVTNKSTVAQSANHPSGNVTVSASTPDSCIGLAVIDNCMLKFTSYGAGLLTVGAESCQSS
jgi:hypothetical protein